MGVGHFAVGFALKRLAPSVSLALLMGAGFFVDFLFGIFVLAGVERASIEPGITAATPLRLEYMPWSHSLVAGLLWAAGLALLWWSWRKDRAGALALGLGVLSHWFLDAASHRPDMPVLWNGPLVGLGLWHSLPATFLVEGAILGLCAWVYARTTVAKDGLGRYGFLGLVAFMAVALFAVYLGPPPPSMPAAAGSLFVLVLPLVFAHVMDRHRATR
jgi:hypothetical protein